MVVEDVELQEEILSTPTSRHLLLKVVYQYQDLVAGGGGGSAPGGRDIDWW